MPVDRRLKIREAIESDCSLLWTWVNDPDVRASAFQSEPIQWEEHVAWFQRKLGDTMCRICMVEEPEGRVVGQVRFELGVDGAAEVDISIARDRRGRDYGAEALRLACERLLNSAPRTVIRAYIKTSNRASIRAFEKAGFEAFGRQWVNGHEAVCMLLAADGRRIGGTPAAATSKTQARKS
jgi:RimJ/RimL family protein N-acetyltransferase